MQALVWVEGTIEFHDSNLRVDVLNRHRSRLFLNHDFAVAEERSVRLRKKHLWQIATMSRAVHVFTRN